MDDVFQRALKKAADILARRNHSEKELREKLSAHFEAEVIEATLVTARERRWLLPAGELAETEAHAGANKQKSARAVNERLMKRGLPLVTFSEDEELEKMKTLLRKKFHFTDPDAMNFNDEDKLKALRLLQARGFDENLIRKVIPDENQYE